MRKTSLLMVLAISITTASCRKTDAALGEQVNQLATEVRALREESQRRQTELSDLRAAVEAIKKGLPVGSVNLPEAPSSAIEVSEVTQDDLKFRLQECTSTRRLTCALTITNLSTKRVPMHFWVQVGNREDLRTYLTDVNGNQFFAKHVALGAVDTERIGGTRASQQLEPDLPVKATVTLDAPAAKYPAAALVLVYSLHSEFDATKVTLRTPTVK